VNAPANVIRTSTGRLCPVCEFCGKVGRAATPLDGRLSLWDVARGWIETPYPPEFVHDDGSIGSLWTCPGCDRRLRRGEALRGRTGSWSRLL
jgi:hypothetical protein